MMRKLKRFLKKRWREVLFGLAVAPLVIYTLAGDARGGAPSSPPRMLTWKKVTVVNIDSFNLVGRDADTAMHIILDTLADSITIDFGQNEGNTVRIRNVNRIDADTVSSSVTITGDKVFVTTKLVIPLGTNPLDDGSLVWDAPNDRLLAGVGGGGVIFVPSVQVSGDATMNTVGAVTVVDDLHDHVITNIDVFSSAQLITRITDETGTGLVVFGTTPTFITNIETPLVLGGTGTTSELRLKTTSGVGAVGADMRFLVGNDGLTEAMTILNNGRVGIGTTAPNAPLDMRGVSPGSVGGFASGSFHVTSSSSTENHNAVITGHNLFGGNKQLWYLGSTSSSNDNIAFINRQNADLSFNTNNLERLRIAKSGNVGIGDASPIALLTVGNGDDFQVTSIGNVSTSGTVDWSGAVSLEIPSATTTAPGGEAHLIYDTDDDWLVTEDADGGNEFVLAQKVRYFSMTIDNTDDLTRDTVIVFSVETEWAPAGIRLLVLGIKTDLITTDTVVFQGYTVPDAGGVEDLIDTVFTAANREAKDIALIDGTVLAGEIIMAELYNITTDVQLQIWGTYFINDN